MKILVLNHEFPPIGGGASPVSAHLCRHLAQRGHSLDIVTMRFADLPPYQEKQGLRIHRTWALRRHADICHTPELATYLLGACPTVRRLLAKKPPDIIHCHFLLPTGPLAYLAARLAHRPWLVTCHGSDVPGHNPERFSLDHKLLLPAWKFLARRAQTIISPSSSLRSLIQHHCPHANLMLIPNGIDIPDYPDTPKQKRIVLCSRLLKFKGFQYALQAMKGLNPDWHIDIIGEGPYRPELQRLANDANLPATFHGWLDHHDPQFKKLYQTGAIFIFPSQAENFPTVLLEAMAARMAVISSNAGGCPEVIGHAGLLVPPKNPTKIRQKLDRLINNNTLRQQLAHDARLRAQQFDWPKIAAQYEACFQNAIDPRRRHP